MTTTIDTFRFTAPAQQHCVRMLTNQEAFDAVIDEIIKEMSQPTGEDNSAYLYIVKNCYTIELAIEFSAHYEHDWNTFEFGKFDFGDWHTDKLTNIEVLDCHKTYMVNGEEYDVDITLDTDKIEKIINKIKFE